MREPAILKSDELVKVFDTRGLLSYFMLSDARLRRAGEIYHVYKYRSIDINSEQSIARAEEIIVQNLIRFSVARSFNDPFDGEFLLRIETEPEKRKKVLKPMRIPGFSPAKRLQAMNRISRAQQPFQGAEEKNWRKGVANAEGIFCAAATPRSCLMWSHYADCHRGFCVQYATYEDPLMCLMKPVEYTPNFPVRTAFTGEEGRHESFLFKSPEWSYEQEMRIVQLIGDASVQVRPLAIKGLIFGARINSKVKDALLGLAEHRRSLGLPAVDIYEAALLESKYSVGIFRGGKPPQWQGRDVLSRN